jgi:hypothetical protein
MSSASSAPNPADVVRTSHRTPNTLIPAQGRVQPVRHREAVVWAAVSAGTGRAQGVSEIGQAPGRAAANLPPADAHLAGQRRAHGLCPGQPARAALACQPPRLGVDNDPASRPPSTSPGVTRLRHSEPSGSGTVALIGPSEYTVSPLHLLPSDISGLGKARWRCLPLARTPAQATGTIIRYDLR